MYWVLTQILLEQYDQTKDGRYYALLGFFYASLMELKWYNDFFKDMGLIMSLLEYLIKEPNCLKDHIFTTQYKFYLPKIDKHGEKTNYLKESEEMDSDYIFRYKAKIRLVLLKRVEMFLNKEKLEDLLFNGSGGSSL